MSFSIRNWGVDYVIVGLVPENLRGNISKGFVMGFYEKGDLKVFFMFLFKVEGFILRLVCTSPKTCTVPEDSFKGHHVGWFWNRNWPGRMTLVLIVITDGQRGKTDQHTGRKFLAERSTITGHSNPKVGCSPLPRQK